MNPLEGLAQYLDRLERRLRLFAWTRGAAAVAGAALILTVAIVGSLILAAFSPAGLLFGRFVLFLGIGGAIAAGLVVPLMRMNRRRAVQEVEHTHPGFDQRLLTFTERSRDNAADPFLPLLAEDALVIARGAEPEQVIEKSRFIQFAGLGAAAATALVYLMFWGPGVFGYGTALLWGSYSKDAPVKPFYSITVQPGTKTIRRKSDQAITASLSGFTSSHANVWVQYASASKWEEAPMQPQNSGPGFAFVLPRVQEDLQYYVEAGGIKSATYKLHTVDLPAVKNLRVTYNYPAWAGMAAVTEDPGGDLRAVEGTIAKVEIQTDKALSNAQIVFEDAKPIELAASKANRIETNIPILKDGTYHIAVMDHGELVRLTDDYFIEARRVGMPTVKITKPGKDAKVSPIEEVGVTVTGEGDFPLQEMDLHYSVNGAPEKVISLLKQKGAKQAEGSALISLEDFKLVPGDIVSVYATAKDGKNAAKTDMYFIQTVPFEFEYSQSQAGGGGGGGGADQQEQQISEREKEIIAATFNQLKGDSRVQAAAAENGKYLSDTQAKLRDQAQSLANRTKARQLDGSGAGFSQFVKEMELAVAAMTPASDKLKGLAFQDAMTPEQQALQHLLRAEATFRQIQIQISKGGGGGGGGGGGAGRDLANLFDLELDKDKNQYETNASSAAEQKQQQVDDALKKLQELAKRQEQLAEQQQKNPQQLAQQRYEQEMLRREAEQVKKEMEALQRGDQSQQGQQQGQQGQQGQQSSSGKPGQSGQSGQSGQQGQQQQSARTQPQRGQQAGQQQNGLQQNGLNRATQEQLDRAIKELDQATHDMSNAASARQPGQGQQNGSQGQSEAQKAAEKLKAAGQSLQSLRKQQNGSELGEIANKAERLAGQQQDFEQRLRRNFGQGQTNQQQAQQMADEKQKMLDEYNQLQKEMQQAARDVAGTQPGVSKDLRNAMGRSQEAEIGTQMEFTAEALRRGMGQYAVMREAPVTRAMNELKDQLKKVEGEASKQGVGGQGSDDPSQMAMQQALNSAERIRKQMEQLNRSQQGNQSGQQKGAGQQPGGQQPGGQQPGGQQAGNGQRGQGGQGQGQGQRGGANNPKGGGSGTNTAARSGNAGGYSDQPYNPNFARGGDTRMGELPPGVTREQAYGDLMRDIGRLRASVADDKDLNKEYQDLVRRAHEMDPRHMTNDGQLGAVVGAQALSEIDELELMLRKKLAAGDGSVRSTNPRNIPPGYANAVAEYTKRLSRQ